MAFLTHLNWKSKRPMKRLHKLLISFYYVLWLMGPYQPSCMASVTTSIFVCWWCLYLATYNICHCYGSYRGKLLTKTLFDQGYSLKNEDLLLTVLWSIQWSITTWQSSHFAVCVWPSPCCALHAPDINSQDMFGYTIDSSVGAWPHQMKFILPMHLFTHLGFPECPMLSQV